MFPKIVRANPFRFEDPVTNFGLTLDAELGKFVIRGHENAYERTVQLLMNEQMAISTEDYLIESGKIESNLNIKFNYNETQYNLADSMDTDMDTNMNDNLINNNNTKFNGNFNTKFNDDYNENINPNIKHFNGQKRLSDYIIIKSSPLNEKNTQMNQYIQNNSSLQNNIDNQLINTQSSIKFADIRTFFRK